MKNNRALSFVFVAVVYLLAIVVGVLSYIYLPLEGVWLRLLAADVIATVFVFIFSCIVKNASVYDPYWSVQPLVILTAFAINTQLDLVRILLLIAVGLWGVRLTANWAYTFKNLTHQDWRYTMLNENTGKAYPFVNFLGIHLFPTLVVYACVLPAVYAFITTPYFNVGTIIGFLICLIAVTLQTVSDIQMQGYRKNKTTTFIRVGLWKNCRHPNYLGEVLVWWGVAIMFVSGAPQYWWLCLGAFVNTLMFIFISIPMQDKRQAKKEGWELYVAETRALVPIPKRNKG